MATAYATGVLVPLIPKTLSNSQRSALPYLPPHSVPTLSSVSSKHSSDSNRSTLFRIKASSSEETSDSADVGKVFWDLKEKWDVLENKSFILYGGGAIVAIWLFSSIIVAGKIILYGGCAIVAIWFSSVIVAAINSVLLLPTIMELVGFGFSGWFVCRYLISKSKVLVSHFEVLMKKIVGSDRASMKCTSGDLSYIKFCIIDPNS